MGVLRAYLNGKYGGILKPGGCRRSRGCSDLGAADGRFVVEAAVWSLVVVVVDPGLEMGIALL